MGHCTRTYLASLNLLLEVFHRDIHPEVTIQVNDNGIDATHSIKDSTQPVVVRNLGSPLLTLQSQFLADKLIAELAPIILGISYMVSIIVTRSATKLSGNRRILQSAQLLFQTIDINHDFLAQTSRRSRLSVGLGQHGHILPLLSIVVQLLYQFFHHRIVHLLQCLLDRKRYAGIVDVLWCQAKVDELLVFLKVANLIQLFLDKILYGLHVVVGRFLYLLHTGSILLCEVTIDISKRFKQVMVKILQLRQREFTKRDEILDLHTYSVANQSILWKISCQFFCLVPVTSVNRRYGGQCVQFHCFLLYLIILYIAIHSLKCAAKVRISEQNTKEELVFIFIFERKYLRDEVSEVVQIERNTK